MPPQQVNAKLVAQRVEGWSIVVTTLSSELVRSALESSPDAMVLVDASGQILYVNQQLSVLFGYAREEARGQRIELLIPERFRLHHAAHREHFAAEDRLRPMGAGLTSTPVVKTARNFRWRSASVRSTRAAKH